ncbi:flavin reductase [Streptomyces wedmorensis]|uniref:flavin reductase family protein n=1 Tax=Streptomyces wedmorensis TaxID=43759 RepID=UPI00341E4A4C
MAALDAFTTLLDPPMYVVTATADDGERAGCPIGFASQSSIRPARFTVWLSRADRTHRVACRASYLTVHLLTTEHRETARLFGEGRRDGATGPGDAGPRLFVLSDADRFSPGHPA